MTERVNATDAGAPAQAPSVRDLDAGDDRLFGNDGDDLLHGSRGDDFHHGGRGTDTCNGAAGSDRAARCERRLNIP